MTFEPRPFRPPVWARGPHLQTLLARALRSSERVPLRRERLETPDGDFLDLDWGLDSSSTSPIVLILHGLEGSTERRYVRNLCRELSGHGILPVAMNFRGCSGEPNRLPRFYHSGETGDPRFVLDVLKERFPGRPLGAFGFSLGGNILLKMLGEDGSAGEERLQAAVAMSVPYDLAAGCRLLETTRMGHFYSWYFLRSLRSKARAKEDMLRRIIDVDAALAATSIRRWDDLATAPLHGFEDAAAYYTASSSVHYLEAVAVPTLLQHAADDPFLPEAAIPRESAAANPHIDLHVHPFGGHVAFMDGSLRSPSFWGEEEGARYLAARLLQAT